MDKQELFAWALETYGTQPDYPWMDGNAVLRHQPSRKWYAVVMKVGRQKLGLAAICGHQRPLVRWQTATVRCVSGQPELAFSRRFCGGERPVCGPAATYSK